MVLLEVSSLRRGAGQILFKSFDNMVRHAHAHGANNRTEAYRAST